MKIHFLGAAQTVTGSMYLLEINGGKLLLECGLYQGHRAEAALRNRNFTFNARKLDAAILSHAHIDHSGNLPNLVRNGYSGPIYTTEATRDLVDLMLMDSAHIQEADAEYLNKKNQRKGLPLVTPLYTRADAAQVVGYVQPVNYNSDFQVLPGVTARLVEAGHILGSASVILTIEGSGNKRHKLWFSGDIGRPGLPLVRDPQLPDGEVNTLMMECTYGDRLHDDPTRAYEKLKDTILRTVNRRGKVIIPAFAVGRTQELVFALNQMMSGGELPRIPVYVDSPLAVNVSEVFRNHLECFDAETREFVREHRHPALDFDMLTYVQSVEESKALNDRQEPMIIISASGMAEVGRILHHLKNNIEDKRNTIIIVSWQAPDTLGRRLVEKSPVVKIFGEEYPVRAEVVTINGFSAHAGQDQLVRYAASAAGKLDNLVFIHGEQVAYQALVDRLPAGALPQPKYPAMGDVLEVDV